MWFVAYLETEFTQLQLQVEGFVYLFIVIYYYHIIKNGKTLVTAVIDGFHHLRSNLFPKHFEACFVVAFHLTNPPIMDAIMN